MPEPANQLAPPQSLVPDETKSRTIYNMRQLVQFYKELSVVEQKNFFSKSTMDSLPKMIHGINDYYEHDITMINKLLTPQQQKEFLKRIKIYKESLSNNNDSNQPITSNGWNYNKLIHHFDDFDKIYKSFDESNRKLFIEVFEPTIEHITGNTKNIEDIKIASKFLKKEQVETLRVKIYDDKWKKMHSGTAFSYCTRFLSQDEKTGFFRYLQSKLISNEFSIIFNAIKNSNKISRNTYRTVKPETKDCSDEDLIKNVTTFFTKLSTNPNSVEAHAWKIYINHSENINTNNQKLMEDIYRSSLKVSFMGISHAGHQNTLFSSAPANSRRNKILKSIQQSGALSNHPSNP